MLQNTDDTAALFTIAKCSSTEEWINKIWYIHTIEYCLALKRNEVAIYATTWTTH